MTKARSISPLSSKARRGGKGDQSGGPQPLDKCELSLAEMRARLERLQLMLRPEAGANGRDARASVLAP